MDATVLASLPSHLRADWAAGSLHRVGMLVFRRGEPGIVAHLVETSALQQMAPSLLSATPPGVALEAAKFAVGTVQNEQIKAGIEVLKSLQLTNLALSGAGLGVSILSYVLLEKRLGRIEEKVDAMDDKLDRIARSIEDLKQNEIRADFTDLRTACEEAEEGWLSSNAEVVWDRAASNLHRLQNKFLDRARLLLDGGRIVEIDPFVEAYSLAATTRLSCRIASGEQALAATNAREYSYTLTNLLQDVNADTLTHAQLKARSISQNSKEYVPALEEERLVAEAKAALYRDQENVALSIPYTLARLGEIETTGRQWLEAARSEETSPLLFLPGKGEPDIGRGSG